MQKTRIGVLTSGGDCPGLNAVIRGICRAGTNLGGRLSVSGMGDEGLLPPGDFMILDRGRTAGIMHLGGTILGTTNRGHFVAKVAAGERAMIPKDIIDQKETFENSASRRLSRSAAMDRFRRRFSSMKRAFR